MEFSEEFVVVQGALITAERAVGELQFLSLKNGDDSKISAVIEALRKVIIRRGIQAGTKLNTKQDQSLRKIFMFLVLNTSVSVREKLIDDINCGHIVYCAPTLSKDLLMELIWSLSLHKYVCESIVHCPLALGGEILDVVLNKMSSVEPLEALLRVEDLSTAVYCKFMKLEHIKGTDVECAKRKLYIYFKNLLQYFLKPNLKELGNVRPRELYHVAGFAMRCILSLMTNCLKLYLNPQQRQECVMSAVYDMSLSELSGGVENENIVITSNDFIDELTCACKTNFCAITVDIWLFWAECEVDGADNNRTLQNEISEAMYCCSEDLKRAQNGEIKLPLAGELITMLSSMAVKPRDEDDEIREAGTELIIKNVSDKSKSQRKWFKALLGLNEIMSDKKCADCLKDNLRLAEYEDIKVILEKAVTALEPECGDGERDKIKRIALESVKHLSLKQQVEIVQWFFKTFGTSDTFLTEGFNMVATEVFNKAVKASVKNDKFFSEFVSLCMQSPVEVITKILGEGLMNSKQISLMVEVLECLDPICRVCELDDIKAASGNEMTLVICLLNDAVKNGLSDLQKSNFVKLVVALINHNIVDGSVFFRRCLLPALRESLSMRSWSLLLVWLEALHCFTDGIVLSSTDVRDCVLLVVLAQVLEISRWNLLTFSVGAASVCEEAITVIRRVLKTFLDTKTTEDKEVNWLQIRLHECLSPLNKSYFSKLWTKFGREWSPGPYSATTFLLDILQIDEVDGKVTDLFQRLDSTENSILFSLSKLLPLCTATEWKTIAQRFKEVSIYTNKISPVPVHLFADSVLLLLFVVEREGFTEDECALSCLDYCVRNLGLILKDEIIQHINILKTEEQVKILIKVLHVLGRLPPSIKDACLIVMLNVVVELVTEVLNSCVQAKEGTTDSPETSSYIRDVATTIGVLGSGEPLKVISKKLLEYVVVTDGH